MRTEFTLVDPAVDTRTTITLDADPSTPLSEVFAELAPVQPADGALYVEGRQLSGETALSSSDLVDGALVGCGRAVVSVWDRDPTAGYELRIVGGPHAGAVFRLGPGSYEIGRDAARSIAIADPDLSRRHLRIDLADDGSSTITDLGSTNGTFLDGRRVDEPTPVALGQVVHAGSSLLAVEPADPHTAELFPDPTTGRRKVNVSPRLSSTTTPLEVHLEDRPERPDPSKFPILMLVAPLVMAGVLAAFTRSPTYLLFGLMSPVMYVGSHFQSKRSGGRQYQKELDRWAKRNDAEQRRLADALESELARRREETPDPATVVLAARGPRRRLWERRPDDPRLGWLRVGTGEIEAAAKVVRAGGTPEAARLYDAPVAFPLLDAGVFGIAGTPKQTEPLARWVALQLAALHSASELRLVVIADHNAAAWEWCRWLPHTKLDDETRAIGNTAETAHARIRELAAMIEARLGERQGLASQPGPVLPIFVVVLDGASRLRALPGVTDILDMGPSVGVYAICVDSNERLLPQEAQATAVFEDGSGPALCLQLAGREATVGVLADGVAQPVAELCARAMAPLEEVGGGAANVAGSLPESLRLLDTIGMPDPSPEQVLSRWRLGGHSSRCTIGRTAAGDFSIDIARDGPHGLVAGTTGAGKSEFLMSFIASLALANRPDAFNFVLVDYKGGTAFKDCARLPHTTGMVTNLDAHLTERALVSLRAEITRREALFRDAGAKEIENYWEAHAHSAGTLPPMPRLLIIIDEFAILARELPDFIGGLIEIAQLGRAFGVHLLLATQRPSGAVSPDIRANSDLRIALRTKEPTDSLDVIDAPDAANIGKSFPGRGFMRTGQEPLVQFQSGRVGGRRPGAVATVRSRPNVRVAPWDQVGVPSRAPTSASVPADDGAETDLHHVVESIIAAAAAEQIPTPASPLLPELPSIITLDEIESHRDPTAGDDPLAVPFALEDLPASQRQVAATFRLGGGHVGIGGSARSGRTTLLRTLAASLARGHWSSDVHVYGIDCGNQGLAVLRQLPHCGAVANRTEADRVARLLDRLNAEITRRQGLLSDLGVSDIVEQRAAVSRDGTADRLPFIVLLVDRWEGFLESLAEVENGKLKEQVVRILKEGQSVGVQAVIAGDRYAVYGEIGALVEQRLALSFNDREEYSFADIRARDLPDDIPPGRVFRAVSQGEMQVAVLDHDLAGQAQNDAFRNLATWLTDRDADVPAESRPFSIGAMPAQVALSSVPRESGSGLDFLVGVGGEQVTPMWVDLEEDGPAFVIGGPPRSGRSTMLCSVAQQCLDRDIAIVIVAPKRSPLTAYADHPGVRRGLLGADALNPQLDGVLDETPVVVLVDDADLIEPGNEALIELAGRRGDRTALVVAGTTEFMRGGGYKSFVAEARKSRCGLLLWPESNYDGQLLAISLPRGTVIAGPPGRGYVGIGGDHALVQVAAPAEADGR